MSLPPHSSPLFIMATDTPSPASSPIVDERKDVVKGACKWFNSKKPQRMMVSASTSPPSEFARQREEKRPTVCGMDGESAVSTAKANSTWARLRSWGRLPSVAIGLGIVAVGTLAITLPKISSSNSGAFHHAQEIPPAGHVAAPANHNPEPHLAAPKPLHVSPRPPVLGNASLTSFDGDSSRDSTPVSRAAEQSGALGAKNFLKQWKECRAILLRGKKNAPNSFIANRLGRRLHWDLDWESVANNAYAACVKMVLECLNPPTTSDLFPTGGTSILPPRPVSTFPILTDVANRYPHVLLVMLSFLIFVVFVLKESLKTLWKPIFERWLEEGTKAIFERWPVKKINYEDELRASLRQENSIQ
eukprot:GHVT01099726.1.p1 GENE.GHVT01099726.1~~GHVT01099726.1.p1  ORF type:complete len:360 (+),score=30.53 GHVT01099726.1:299-1378(+)